MDATERARLRALCETIPAGAVTPCCERAGEDVLHHSSWSLGMMAYGAAIRAWLAGPLDLLALARTAIPALLDALDAAERERDEARAEVARAVLAEREACAAACDEIEAEAEAEIGSNDRRDWPYTAGESAGAYRCAEAIRARGAGGGV